MPRVKAPPIESIESKKQKEVVQIIAKNIGALADSVTALLGGELNRKAIILLLAHSAGLPQGTVNEVLIALTNLKKDFLNSR